MSKAYDNALAERARLMERIKVIDEFIAVHDRFMDGTSRNRLSCACIIGIVNDAGPRGMSASEIVEAAKAIGHDARDSAVRQHLYKAERSGWIRKVDRGRYARGGDGTQG